MASTAKDSEAQSPGIGTSTQPEGGTIKSQPVALEVPVTVNGARAVEGSDKREPFSETTKTVLIFVNGAVIRLASMVAPGQLLFLTNENTKKEVVCQVVKSKNYRSVSGYVELEFTEASLGFWGMRFPSERAMSAAPRNPVTPPAAANLPSSGQRPAAPLAGATPGASKPAAPQSASPAASAQPPTRPAGDPETEALRQEAARLQQQLAGLLFTQNAGAKAPVQPPKRQAPAAPEPKAKVIEMAHRTETAPSEPTPQPPNRNAAAPSQPPVAQKSTLDLGSDEVKIPAWLEPLARNAASPSVEAPPPAELDLFEAPEPAAPTSREVSEPVPHGEAFPAAPSSQPYASEGLSEYQEPSTKSGKGLLIGLVAAGVIAAAAGGAWYFGFRKPATTPANASTFATLPASDRTAALSAPTAAGSQPISGAASASVPPAGSPGAAEALRTAAAKNSPPVVNAREVEKMDASRSAQPDTAQTGEQPKRSALGRVKLAAPMLNTKRAQAEDVAAPHFNGGSATGADPLNTGLIGGSNQPVVPLEVGGDVKAARLLHSVPPVYPTLARSQRVSGDVKIDALVDATGHVSAMKVVSGPVLLHQAAMDALRQWRYQPAMLDGKPVPMHLTVVVQFRLQ